MLPVATETMIHELESVKALLEKWVAKAKEGVPGVDTPITGMTEEGDRLDVWLTELVGELRLISGKTQILAEILAGTVLE